MNEIDVLRHMGECEYFPGLLRVLMRRGEYQQLRTHPFSSPTVTSSFSFDAAIHKAIVEYLGSTAETLILQDAYDAFMESAFE